MNRTMPFRILFLCLALIPVATLEAQPNPKKPGPKGGQPNPTAKQNEIKALFERLHHLNLDIQKIRIEAVPSIVKANERFQAAQAQFHQTDPLPKLLAERHMLHQEEQLALDSTIDPTKAKAIKAHYRKLIADLEKQFGPKRKEIDAWNQEKNDKIRAIEMRWDSEIAKINPAENKLEARLHQLIHEQHLAMVQLLDQTKGEHKDLIAKYEQRISELQQKYKDLEQQTLKANEVRQTGIATVEADLQTQLASLTSAEEKAIARKDAVVKIKTLDREYHETLAVYNPPENRIETQIGRIRSEEMAEIKQLEDPAQVKAVHDRFSPRITELERKIRGQDGEKARLIGKRDAEIRVVENEYRAKIDHVDPPSDRFAAKLEKLKSQERAELKAAHDPTKIAAIEAAFKPKLEAVAKAIHERNQHHQRLVAKHHHELEEIHKGVHQKIAPLQIQVNEVMQKLAVLMR